jgi:hypothetical protein
MSEKSNRGINPNMIRYHSDAVTNAFAMLAGMQLDVFTPLKNGPMSAETLAKSLDVQTIKLTPLLYCLVMADLLTVEDGIFSNTDEVNRFLVNSSLDYMGKWLSSYFNRRWNAVMQTEETIRTGNPQAKRDWQTLEEDRLFEILSGLHPDAIAAGKQLAKKFGFLNIYDGGQAFSESEHRDWLVDAGFTDVSIEYEAMPFNLSIVSARKA